MKLMSFLCLLNIILYWDDFGMLMKMYESFEESYRNPSFSPPFNSVFQSPKPQGVAQVVELGPDY